MNSAGFLNPSFKKDINISLVHMHPTYFDIELRIIDYYSRDGPASYI